MTIVASFPILQLPQRALNKSLQYLAPKEIINFSLVSNSTKQTAQALNLRAAKVSISFDEIITVVVDFSNRTYTGKIIQWEPSQVGLRKLVDHALLVFHVDDLDRYSIQNDAHDWKHMSQELDGLTPFTMNLSVVSKNSDFQKFVNQFSTEELCVESDIAQKAELHEILCAQRRQVTSYGSFPLSNLLNANCKKLIFNEVHAPNDLNLFLKHWINGSNITLRGVIGDGIGEVDDQFFFGLFNGIDHTVTPIADLRKLIWIPEKANDIYNCYGTRATVFVSLDNFFKMYVWDLK